MTCPEHGVLYPCPVPISLHWAIVDDTDGWYVERPDGKRWGPFTEDQASAMLPVLREREGFRDVPAGYVFRLP